VQHGNPLLGCGPKSKHQLGDAEYLSVAEGGADGARILGNFAKLVKGL
jgi:hypothetical protein